MHIIIKKSKDMLRRYTKKTDSVHHAARLLQARVREIEEQLLIAEITYELARERCVVESDQHHRQCEAERKPLPAALTTAMGQRGELATA